VTFAQTWDVSYGPDGGASAAPSLVSASPVPDLPVPDLPDLSVPAVAAACTGACSSSVRQVFLAIGPESAKAARDFTKSVLREWGLDALVSEAALIASELVTNAIRHGACGPAEGDDEPQEKVELAWQRQVGRVICVVTDRSPLPPVLGAADSDAESGRGLQVVAAIAAAWGWTMLGACNKAVWAALGIL
jgi:anti-sigma regulatory factor (Ser/Thr protein kinase)